MNIIKTLVTHDFCKSMAEARRLVSQGGVKVNHEKVTDPTTVLKHNDFITTGKAHRPISVPIETVMVHHGHNDGIEMSSEDAVAYIAKGLARGQHNFVITKVGIKASTEAVYYSDSDDPKHHGDIHVTIPIMMD